MAARFSGARLPAAAGLAGAADELRRQAERLADQDAAAYRGVLAAYRLPRGQPGGDRAQRISAALHGAAVIPLQIAEVAAQVAGLAGQVAAGGNRNLRGDTITAAYLAEAAALSAAALVDLNVAQGGLPADLAQRAARAAAAAQAAADQVRTVGTADGS